MKFKCRYKLGGNRCRHPCGHLSKKIRICCALCEKRMECREKNDSELCRLIHDGIDENKVAYILFVKKRLPVKKNKSRQTDGLYI